jgi:hypothetical protein
MTQTLNDAEAVALTSFIKDVHNSGGVVEAVLAGDGYHGPDPALANAQARLWREALLFHNLLEEACERAGVAR